MSTSHPIELTGVGRSPHAANIDVSRQGPLSALHRIQRSTTQRWTWASHPCRRPARSGVLEVWLAHGRRSRSASVPIIFAIRCLALPHRPRRSPSRAVTRTIATYLSALAAWAKG
jgi:hypothetical protein